MDLSPSVVKETTGNISDNGRRSLSGYLTVTLRGMVMGAADVIPGVSGGTIAFITGIYEELIRSLRSLTSNGVRLLLKGDLSSFIKVCNIRFLIALFAGIAISVFSLAKLVTWLLETWPLPLWGFFFGLILCSSWLVLRSAGKIRGVAMPIAFIAGVAVSLFITSLAPASSPQTLWFVAISGSVSICAMILPGISGAFILILIGNYLFLMQAVSELNVVVIITFMAGAATGLVLFSNLLGWLLNRFRSITIALLSGFMLGSLRMVWPWRVTAIYRTSESGEQVPYIQQEVLPSLYGEITGNDPQLAIVIAALFAGLLIPLIVEITASSKR